MTTAHPMQRTFDELRRARRDDPATSKDAARRCHGLAGEHARLILATLAAAGVPLTGHDIAARCELTPVQVLRRTAQLRDDGQIVADGFGTSPSGCKAQRWRLA